jgi:hypothetical protein
MKLQAIIKILLWAMIAVLSAAGQTTSVAPVRSGAHIGPMGTWAETV